MKVFTRPDWYKLCLVVFIFAALFISCDSESGGKGDSPEPLDAVYVTYSTDATETPYDTPIIPIVAEEGESTVTVKLSGLEGQNVFLAKANVSKTNTKTTASTGKVTAYTKNLERIVSRSASLSGEGFSHEHGRHVLSRTGNITRYDHEEARRFSANPPVQFTTAAPRSVSGDGTARAIAQLHETRDFWVENQSKGFVQIPATLRAQEDSCNVWIATDNYSNTSKSKNDNKIKVSQAQEIARKFNGIRDRVTAVLGYEYGGAPDSKKPGGIDGDSRIQILVYDIGYDYSPNQDTGVLGYFWGKDEYLRSQNQNSNEAEIFYIDAHFTDSFPNYIISTLVHEYQHMINFNRNVLAPDCQGNPETWFNEMLSLITEDLFGPELEIEDYIYPRNSRIPLFLSDYRFVGLTEWLTGDDVLSSYGFSYTFGAYIMRNYGGAELLTEIMDNPYINAAAISRALYTLNAKNGTSFSNSDTAAFNEVFLKFVQTLVFSGESIPGAAVSFDKESIYSSVSSAPYKFEKFDVWAVRNNFAGYSNIPSEYCGPLVWELGDYTMKGYGIDLQSTEDWQNVTGTLTVELSMPINAEGVQMFLIIR